MERWTMALVIVVAGFSLACGLLDEEVSYTESFDTSFTVDASRSCPDSLTYCQGNQVPAPRDQQLAPLTKDVDIDIVDRTGNEELRDYTGKFKSIEIKAIEYTISGNDLTFDIPPTDIYVGPVSADSTDDEGVVRLATLPQIAAGANEAGSADVDASNRGAVSDLFKKLKLSTIFYTVPEVKQGDPLPPSGSADITLTLKVRFAATAESVF